MNLIQGPAPQVSFTMDTSPANCCKFGWQSPDPHDPNTYFVLTMMDEIQNWGIVRSIQARAFRDGQVAKDMQIISVDVSEILIDGSNSLALQFEIQKYGNEDHTKCIYQVRATVDFVPINPGASPMRHC